MAHLYPNEFTKEFSFEAAVILHPSELENVFNWQGSKYFPPFHMCLIKMITCQAVCVILLLKQ